MKEAIIYPSVLNGEVTVPPSKSVLHRAIICAMLAKGKSVIKNAEFSKDITATINAAKAMGADITFDGETITVNGGTFTEKKADINCFESGSTLRFMVPVAAALGIDALFTGEGRLPQRPIKELTEIISSGGVKCSGDALPLEINGKLIAGEYKIRGDISSQYITGLLLSLPLCDGDSKVELLTPLQSKGYVDITIGVMEDFGVKVTPTENGWIIKGNQIYTPREFTAEGDWSQAAFFLTAAALNKESEIAVKGLNPLSKQGDREIFDILDRFGADIKWNNGKVICKGNELNSLKIDASQIPDLVPILGVLIAFSKKQGEIFGAERLRIKESDRLYTLCDGLLKLGFKVHETDGGIIFSSGSHGTGECKIKGYNDHRIVMAMSVAALYYGYKVTIDDAQSIEKSYPRFFEDYNSLGGKADVVNIR